MSTKAKKTEPYFEPCPHSNCRLRFGSPESLNKHIEKHRQEYLAKAVPTEQRGLLDPAYHADTLMHKLKQR